MSSSSNTITTNTGSLLSSQNLPLLTINAAAHLPIKLNTNNFPSWRTQFQSLLIGFDLLGCVDGSNLSPPKEIEKTGTTNMVANPAYEHWLRQERLILHGMIASSSEAVVSHLASTTSSHDAWAKLNKIFANKSRSRMMSLKEKLTTPRGSKSISEYFQTLRSIADELALINTVISEDELVIHALNGAGTEYRELAAGIRAREYYISFEELLDKFVDYEESY